MDGFSRRELTSQQEQNRILGIGIATLDIINSVNHYPNEDEEMRVSDQRVATGGNVTNTLTILAQAGYHCDFVGVLTDDNAGKLIKQKMQSQLIDISYVEQIAKGASPTSYITLNQQTGSRTILHHRDLPELTATHFKQTILNHLADYSWLHFEGRNIAETKMMMESCKPYQYHLSVELEKPREGDELQLIPLADTIMFSKAYMQTQNKWLEEKSNPEQFLRQMQQQYPKKNMTCTLGEQGAYGLDANGTIHFCPAIPVNIVDTLGAGDTFNAGLIDGLCRGESLSDAMQRATSLAAKKVVQQGLLALID